jgi:hypothetical protein
MKAKREKIAKAIGLIDRGWKYNVACDEPDLKERFYCRKDNWKPDEDWNQMIFAFCNIEGSSFDELIKQSFNKLVTEVENK